MNFIKKYKIFLSVILCTMVVLYAGFVFALPELINLNNYKKDIQEIICQSAKLNFDVSDIKLVTTPSLKAGVNLKNLKISYPEGKEIATVKNAQVKISLLPLILKTLKISDISVDSPVLNLTLLSDGQLDLVKYITQTLEQTQQTSQTTTAEMPVKFSSALPVVTVKDLSLRLKDEKSSNTFTLNTNNFVFDKAVLNKHLRVTTDGKIFVNDKENVNFDVRLYSFWPAVASNTAPAQTQNLPQIDFIKELVKYDPKAVISADIAAKEHQGHIDLDGYLNIDKLSIKLNGDKLPDSYFHLLSKGHETDIDANVYVSATEKASLVTNVKTGSKTKLDIKFNTDKISFSSIQNFAIALLNSLNMQNDLASLKVQGYIKSNFNVKTDLKEFESSGKLNVVQGSVTHNLIPVKISDITANIDFSNNALNIINAHTFVNGTKISAMGSIKSNSDTDITVKSDDINIAPLFNAFAPMSMKQSFLLNSGILNIDIILKGKLAKIQPDIDVALSKFALKTKAPMPAITTKINTLKLDVDPKQAVINSFDVILNSSKIKVSGTIKDYLNDMEIAVNADGSIKASDINSLLPKEARTLIGTNGAIPIKAVISGNLQKIDINAQAYPDANNNFSPVSVKKMLNKNGLVNAEMTYSNDKLNIADASLYMPSKSNLGQNFVQNKKGATKIAGITGSIANISSSYPEMKLLFSIPEPVILSHTLMNDASLSAKGDLNIYGTFNNPSYKGFISIKDINLPALLTKVQGVDLEFNGDTISANIQNLDINKTVLNIIADASTKFGNVFLIKSMKLSSLDLNVDNLFKAMDKMNALLVSGSSSSASSGANATVLPVKISNGNADFQKFTMKQMGGNLVATNVTGSFTLINDLVKIPDLKADVYGGTVSADVSYNVKTTEIKAKVKGLKINANQAITVFTGLKDQIQSNLDFNADVKLKGATYEQQMKSLNGNADFELKDGQLGSLGRFETFLQADNLLSQSFVKTKLGSLINTISPYNTGQFSYLNGKVKLSGGNAILEQVKMSGAHMSLLLKGSVNLLSMDSNIEILGSLSQEVTNALGPVADLSVEKFVALIPNFGTKIASAMNSFNEAANKAVLQTIPALTPGQSGTKSFKVKLNGNLNNPASAFDGFKWLNTPEKIQQEQAELTQQAEKQTAPVTKEEIKQNIKEQVKQSVSQSLQNNEKVQKLKENKAVKAIGGILQIYKTAKDAQESSTKDSSTTQNQTQTTQTEQQ